MTMEQEILDYVTKHWIDNSTGISALDISKKFSIRHEKAKASFKKLSNKGLGCVKENVTLYTVNFNVSLDDPQEKRTGKLKSRKRNTSIFFPSKTHLKNYFNANILQFHADGKYRNLLRLGVSQIDLVFFKLSVLKKYIDHQEKYRIDDNIVSGDIHVKDSYYFSLPEDVADKESFARIRYGKRKLESGEYCVCALLCDLAEAPIGEQLYWASNELENPAFSRTDVEFDKFCAQSYGGMFVNHDDPLDDIKSSIERINELFRPGYLFQYSENSYLTYPILNTRKNFADCCSELYKLIDDSSLNREQMLNLFNRIDNFDKKTLVDQTGKEISKISMFKKLICTLLPSDSKSINQSFLAIRDGRVEGDHKITAPKIDPVNYVDKFKSICNDLKLSLIKIEIALKPKLPNL
jgi:hypothetical protein